MRIPMTTTAKIKMVYVFAKSKIEKILKKLNEFINDLFFNFSILRMPPMKRTAAKILRYLRKYEEGMFVDLEKFINEAAAFDKSLIQKTETMIEKLKKKREQYKKLKEISDEIFITTNGDPFLIVSFMIKNNLLN